MAIQVSSYMTQSAEAAEMNDTNKTEIIGMKELEIEMLLCIGIGQCFDVNHNAQQYCLGNMYAVRI